MSQSYQIPVQFSARPYRGQIRKKSVREIEVFAGDFLSACREARERAANMIGRTMVNSVLVYVFRVHSVEVRADLYLEAK